MTNRITLPPDMSFGWSLAPNSANKTKRAHANGPCRELAPCGEKCVCSADYVHSYHICKRADCIFCHGRQRYEGKKQP